MSADGIAHLMVRCLENEGVTHVFGIPGEENIHLLDALARSSIRELLPVLREALALDTVSVIASPAVTHIRYRIERG